MVEKPRPPKYDIEFLAGFRTQYSRGMYRSHFPSQKHRLVGYDRIRSIEALWKLIWGWGGYIPSSEQLYNYIIRKRPQAVTTYSSRRCINHLFLFQKLIRRILMANPGQIVSTWDSRLVAPDVDEMIQFGEKTGLWTVRIDFRHYLSRCYVLIVNKVDTLSDYKTKCEICDILAVAFQKYRVPKDIIRLIMREVDF